MTTQPTERVVLVQDEIGEYAWAVKTGRSARIDVRVGTNLSDVDVFRLTYQAMSLLGVNVVDISVNDLRLRITRK